MTEKWQRLTYMPATTIGKDGRRITGSPEHIALSRKAATEGMVLLKNDQNILPLSGRVAVFGKGQYDYVKGGGGSGDTTVAYVRSLAEGLAIKAEEGKLELFAPLMDFYRENVRAQYAEGVHPGNTVEPALSEALLSAAREFTDTALISICRFSGEGYDRTGSDHDGDFYLSLAEEAMVEAVRARFPRVAVVLNTGGMMDTLWFKDTPSIGAALLAWQAGMEGGLATADVLVGDICPSGHLTDTFASSFDAYPSSANFNESENYVEYHEDIFVGYRYFETFERAAKDVLYPFGFGLSYTTFSFSALTGSIAEDETITLRATVTNTGSVAGKQVAQAYCRAPRGRLDKPACTLVGFAKTKLLEPGESETLSISFVPYGFASYDDTGVIARSAYVLEKGEYTFQIGDNVRQTAEVPFVYALDADRVLVQLSEKCVPKQLHKRLRESGKYEEIPCEPDVPRAHWNEALIPYDGQRPSECRWEIPGCAWAPEQPQPFMDVAEGKRSLDEFISLLNDEQKIHLLGGQPNRGPANTFGFGNLMLFGIPNVMTADGPAGLRIVPACGVNTTAFPCATLLACSWNTPLVEEVGAAGAKEVVENGIGVWLTPAINIHRTPLCGRNFEYYSEDPLVAGKMAAAMVRGIQSQGVAASLKHFACNNKETNRRESDSRLSERALREIYIKGFEICVKEADPWTIMSSYNIINGVRASENKDLLTDILRGEWNFDGAVTTDWYTHAEQFSEINAGNDIKMGRGMPEATYEALLDGRLSREAMETSVRRVLRLLLKLK